MGSADVVRRPLLLDEGCGIEVNHRRVPLLHVGDSHLRGKSGLQGSLRLHFGHLLCLGGIQEIQLLDFAICGT